MNIEERKAWLEDKLGCPIPDPVWDELEEGYVSAGDMEWEDEELLIDRAQSYLRVRRRNLPDFGMSPRRFSPHHDIPPWMDTPDDVRREVFAKCVAYVAEDHPDVCAFRDEVLSDSYPLTYDQALHYVDEDGQVREDAPYAQRLEDLTRKLAKTFVWKAHDASWFVLCAHFTPPVRTFSVESNVTRYEGGPEIGTITLTVEPWLPVEAVAQTYKQAQLRMLGKRTHQVSPSRLRLLELVETMGHGLSWRERMDLWNEFHPYKKYKDRSNFRKAYKEVRAQVLKPGYTAPRRDEEAAREDRRRDIKLRLKNIDRVLKIIRKHERDMRIVREGDEGTS